MSLPGFDEQLRDALDEADGLRGASADAVPMETYRT